jgi:hypothetical protein
MNVNSGGESRDAIIRILGALIVQMRALSDGFFFTGDNLNVSMPSRVGQAAVARRQILSLSTRTELKGDQKL